MIVEGQKVKVTWNNRLAKHYISKGYPVLKPFEEFEVAIEDLPESSNQKVTVKCDNDNCDEVKMRPYAQAKNSEFHYCSAKCRKNFIRYDKEFLISEFYRYFNEFGEYPQCNDMQDQKGFPSHYNYTKLWGSWNNFIDETDIKADGHGNWLKEDIETLKELYEYSPKEVILNRLVNNYSWNHICFKANQLGLSRKFKEPSKRALSKEFLITEFWRFFDEFGRYPYIKDMTKSKGYPSESGYNRIWGNWDNFLKDTGIVDKNNLDGWYIIDENVLKEKYYEGNQEDIIDSLMVKRKWGRIVRKANLMGLKRNKSVAHKIFTDEELITKLKELSCMLGRTPKDHDIRKMENFPSTKVYQNRFGSWNNALKEAGLEVNVNKKYTKEELIQKGKDFYNTYGRNPNYNELGYSRTVFKHFWNNWDDFLKECGFILIEKRSGFKNKKDSIIFLKTVSKELGFIPTATLLKEQYNIYTDWYTEHFGSYNKALFASGLVPIEYTYNKEKIVEESINILKKLYLKKESPPTANEYDLAIQGTPFLNRKALESNLNMKFGDICLNFLGEANQYKKTKEELLNELITLKENLGRPPYIKELKQNGLSSFSQYQTTFGKTFAEIMVDLGWEKELPYSRPKFKSENDLLQDYLNLYNSLGRIPFREDVDSEETMCNYYTYINRFGSLKYILDMLKIDYPSEIINYSYGQGCTCFDKNGEVCRSYGEMLISNYLIENDITYIKEFPYSKVINNKKSKKRFDWYLPKYNIFVEYFGLFDEKNLQTNSWIGDYSRDVIEKIRICKENNLTLIEIYHEDTENQNFMQKINEITNLVI